jgi:hypothetical protein
VERVRGGGKRGGRKGGGSEQAGSDSAGKAWWAVELDRGNAIKSSETRE